MILAIDGTNWVHLLWYATHGAAGVSVQCCQRVEALAERLKASHVIAAFDRRSFRHDLYPPYKANRAKKDAALIETCAETELEMTRVAQVIAQTGYEADDCLASIAAARGEDRVVVATSDKDLRQCLTPGYVVTLRGFTLNHGHVDTLDWFTIDMLKEQYGLTPTQWTSYQALVGDSSDGLPGCPGWGEKTAKAALADGRMLHDVLADHSHVKLTAKQLASLASFDACLMLNLVTLKTDVPAAVDALR